MSDYICNWEKCFLSQENLDENKLVCPAANPNVRHHPEELKITYLTQIKNRLDLSQIGQLPTNISVVWLCALKTKNYTLAAKFSEGDMIATDAEYHLRCLSSLYRAANSVENETEMNK